MFSLKRSGAALAVVLAALSLTVASAQSGASPQPPARARRKFEHKLKIDISYHKSTDTTNLTLLLKEPDRLARLSRGGGDFPNLGTRAAFGEDVTIFAQFSHPGKSLARPVEEAKLWIIYTGGATLAVTSELRALVDGREVLLSRQVEANLNRRSDGSTAVASLTLPLTRAQIAQLAGASEVTLMLPSGEYIKLGREQLNALTDFEGRMTP
jgi:hypothetical protein